MSHVHNTLAVAWGPLAGTLAVLCGIGALTVIGKAIDAAVWLAVWLASRGTRAVAGARYQIARRMLYQNAIAEHEAGIDHGTELWKQLRREAVRAEDGVGWLRRQAIDRRLRRELDYDARISQPAGAGAAPATGPRRPRQPSPGGQR